MSAEKVYHEHFTVAESFELPCKYYSRGGRATTRTEGTRDPGLYLARRSQIFQATQKQPTPEAFKLFTGSPWVILSRAFLDYYIFGWDNLPRYHKPV